MIISAWRSCRDLQGLEEMKGAGLLSSRIPANFNIPSPLMSDELTEDEDPITQLDLEELGSCAWRCVRRLGRIVLVPATHCENNTDQSFFECVDLLSQRAIP